jgi:hypothetical protein
MIPFEQAKERAVDALMDLLVWCDICNEFRLSYQYCPEGDHFHHEEKK